MLKHVILSNGDAALIVNDTVVMSAEPTMGDPSHVEMVAERLAEALSMPLQRIEREAPGEPEDGEENWTWEGIASDLAVEGAFQPEHQRQGA